MSTHVIILCQGVQSRLPDLKVPKQLVTLDRGAPTESAEDYFNERALPILSRTMLMVAHYLPAAEVRIVGWRMSFQLWLADLKRRYVDTDDHRHPRAIAGASLWTLDHPGNSSLKGFAQTLALRGEHENAEAPPSFGRMDAHDRTVVLLGDVIYDHHTMAAILRATSFEQATFYVSHDISQGSGELWAISWPKSHDAYMQLWIDAALAFHPPFSTYQPGQLRQVMFRAAAALNNHMDTWTTQITQYLHDLDVPKDLARLAATSRLALADDRANGAHW